jgi:hypothetical protein
MIFEVHGSHAEQAVSIDKFVRRFLQFLVCFLKRLVLDSRIAETSPFFDFLRVFNRLGKHMNIELILQCECKLLKKGIRLSVSR